MLFRSVLLEDDRHFIIYYIFANVVDHFTEITFSTVPGVFEAKLLYSDYKYCEILTDPHKSNGKGLGL